MWDQKNKIKIGMDTKYPHILCNSQRTGEYMCVFIFLSKQIKNSTTGMNRVSTGLTSPWGTINKNDLYFSGSFSLAHVEHQPTFWLLLFPSKFFGFPVSHQRNKCRQLRLLTAIATLLCTVTAVTQWGWVHSIEALERHFCLLDMLFLSLDTTPFTVSQTTPGMHRKDP